MLTPPDSTLMALLASSTAALAKDPKNETLRTGILQNQVALTSKQLNLTTSQAADVVRTYTAAYTYSKGYDPQATLDALTSAQQQIINYDKNKPTLYGMDLVSANKVASYFAAAAGPILGLSILAFTIALFMIGPEAAAAVAGAGGLVEAVSAVTGVAIGSTGGAALAIGTFLFLISQFLGHMSSSIPMWTKQMVDNGTIAASLQITAIKNVTEITAKLTGTKAPGPYSAAQFSSLVNGLRAAGITQIKDPNSGQLVPFSEVALAALINFIYGNNVTKGLPATPTKITPLLQPWLYKGAINNSIPLSLYDQVSGTPATTSQGTAAQIAVGTTQTQPTTLSTSKATTTSTPKIFTGIVSQGVLSSVADFTPRPDDLITSVGDLEAAATNNLAPFIASLGKRIVYEIKIVSSVTTKDGFIQRGLTQKIQSGTNANGTPKYKTVTNRFAVLNLYILNKSGARTSLTQIVLGPTDAVQFQPNTDDLAAVQAYLQGAANTNDIAQIVQVGASQSLAVATGVPATPATGTATPPQPNNARQPYDMRPGVSTIRGTPGERLYYGLPNGDYIVFPVVALYTDAERQAINAGGQTVSAVNAIYAADDLIAARFGTDPRTLPQINEADLGTKFSPFSGKQADTKNGIYDFLQAQSGAPAVPILSDGTSPSVRTPAQAAAQAATTLYDYYTALGQTLPSVSDRSKLYEQLGLGTASFYTGTAEQNNKLLAMLKTRD